MRLNLFFGFIAFLILFVFAGIIADIYSKPIENILRVVSFIFLLTPFIEAVKAYGIGHKKVKIFVLLSIVFQAVMILSLIFLFKIGKTGLFAAIAFFVANFISFLFAACYIDFRLLLKKEKNKVILRMNKYIKNGFVYGLTRNLYFQSPFIVGGYFVGSTNLAFYSIGLALGTQGLFTFITAVQTMLLPYIAVIKNKTKMSEYISVVIKGGIIVTVLLSLVILVLVYLLLPYFFPEYINSFKYIPWIFLAFGFLNFRAPMALYKASERTDILTKISVATAISSIFIGIIMSYLFGLIGMIITLNLSVLLSSYLHIYFLDKIGNVKVSLKITKSDFVIFRKYFYIFINSFKKKYF